MRDFVSRAKYKLGGLGLLAIVALLLFVAGGIYTKAFRDAVPVTLRTTTAGSQLNQYAPVKIRGVQVGEVDSVTTERSQAVFRLALRPDMIDEVPANVRARVVQKTLLGERYVQFVIPDDPTPARIAAGDVIGTDRSSVSVELRSVFEQTVPVLQAVQPVKINRTLNAIATAVRGRGDQLGATLVRLRNYLSGLNPSLATLQRDLEQLATVTDIYADATPDLIRVLDNTTFTGNTVVDVRNTLDVFLRDVTGLAGTGEQFLRNNGGPIIAANDVSRPTLQLLARYSPGLPCTFAGLDKLQRRARAALGGDQPALHVTVEVAQAPPPYQYAGDLPDNGPTPQRLRSLEELTGFTVQRGPHCYGLPNAPQPFPTPQEFNGSDFATELNSGVDDE